MDPPAHILIVEDEPITALDVARRLRRLGYQVVALASSGPQAIQYALSHRPHIVLMDIHLQGTMDGIDAARHIQAAAPIPVVYMSAYADAATIERLQAITQAAGFVPKPIHPPTLHATLQRVCSRPQGDPLLSSLSPSKRLRPSRCCRPALVTPSFTLMGRELDLARDTSACGMTPDALKSDKRLSF
jgi:CheY-like chemotaxis protein